MWLAAPIAYFLGTRCIEEEEGRRRKSFPADRRAAPGVPNTRRPLDTELAPHGSERDSGPMPHDGSIPHGHTHRDFRGHTRHDFRSRNVHIRRDCRGYNSRHNSRSYEPVHSGCCDVGRGRADQRVLALHDYHGWKSIPSIRNWIGAHVRPLPLCH